MELLLMCIAVAYTLTGKFNKDTAQSAYKAGKEPPGLVKARMRHENGGGGWKPRPGKSSTPKGQGATRLLLSQRWANACERAKDRADDKHRRWRAWYAEQAPERDEQWRTKQSNRIAKSEQRAEKFARARGILTHPVQTHQDKQEQQAWEENARREQDVEQRPESDTEQMIARARDEAHRLREQEQDQSTAAGQASESNPAAESESSPPCGDGGGDGHDEPALPDIPTQNTGSTRATEQAGGTVYQQAAAKLHEHADEVEDYVRALTALGDDLEGIGWGSEVHGPLADMHTHLSAVAGTYRDLAEQIKAQGDEVADAHDEAPWVPDAAVLA